MQAGLYLDVKSRSRSTKSTTVMFLTVILLSTLFSQETTNKDILETRADSLIREAEQLSVIYSYDDAIEALKHALAIEQQLNRPQNQASILYQIADISYRTSQYNNALSYSDSVLPITRNIEASDRECQALILIAASYECMSEYAKALAYCDTAFIVLNKKENPTLHARVLNTAGQIYYSMSEYDKALEHCDSALAIARNHKDIAGEAKALEILGAVYDNNGEYDRALRNYRASYAISKDINDMLGETTALRSMGRSYYFLSMYDSSLHYYRKSLRISGMISDLNGKGHTLNGIGLLFYHQGHYMIAVKYLESALNTRNQIKDYRGLGTTLYNLGVVYSNLSKFEQALANFDSSLAIMRKVKSKYTEGSALTSKGIIYRLLGKYEHALACFDSALTIADQTNDHYGASATLNNMAIIYHSLELNEKALAYYDSALTIKRALKLRLGESSTLHNMGCTYRDEGEYERALSHFDSALVIQRDINDRNGQARTLDDIGVAYYLLGQYDRALAYLDSSLHIKRDLQSQWTQAMTLGNIGRVHLALANYENAFLHFDSAYSILDTLQDRPHKSVMLDYIGQVHEATGDMESAIAHYKQAIEVKEEIRSELRRAELRKPYVEAEKDIYQRLAVLLIMLGRYEEAFDYLERSRSERLRRTFEMSELVAFDPSLNRTLQRINLLTSEIEGLRKRFQAGKIEEATYDQEHHELQGRFNQIMLDLKIHHPRLYNVMVPQQWVLEDIQGIMPDSTLFIGFTETNDKYSALIFSKDMYTVEPREELKDSIDQWVIRALSALKRHAPEDEIHEHFAQLYQALLKPSETELTKYDNIVFIPYGILHYVPFHMLRYADEEGNHHYLMERNRVSYLPSASFLTDLLKEQEEAPQELLAFGNADGTLPNAELEVDLIAQLFDRSYVCKCDSARKDRFIEMANDYELIHLATHGILAYDPRFSHIVLAPEITGNLTVREIFGLSGYFQKTSLVTLSACETAVEAEPESAGMELVTLSNAFKVAGVPTTIASLWEIADRSTAVLMENFYKNLKDKSMDKLDALRHAQLSMLNHAYYAHPFYWAPFILIGNWE